MEGISNASWYPAVQSLMCKQDHIGFNMAIWVTFLVASAMAMLSGNRHSPNPYLMESC